jgi:predicted nucleic acid-binding protein
MKISFALQSVTTLFLDTAPVIYLIEKNPVYLDRVLTIFQHIDAGLVAAMTSPVTLAECLVHPWRTSDATLRQTFINVLVKGFNTTFAEIDRQTGETAAKLRADYNLPLPHALQLAVAITNGCDAFLTNDAQLKRVIELPVLVLDDLPIG